MLELSDADEARLFGQYRNAWKHLARDAPGVGEAARIDADGELTQGVLEEALDWVDHKAGGLDDHTLVAHISAHDALTDPDLVGQGHYWTGDSGTFDSGEVVSVGDYGPVRVRWSRAIPPSFIALVELDQMTLTGNYRTFTHERGLSREIDTTAHPYAVITGLPRRDDWPQDDSDEPQAMADDSGGRP